MLRAIAFSLMFVTGLCCAQGQDRFETSNGCVVAIRSGGAISYVPSFLNAHREPAGSEKVRGLEVDACVKMKIVGRVAWVPQAKGEQFIFNGIVPVARWDCGNEVFDIVYVPPTPPPASAPPPPAPKVVKTAYCELSGSLAQGFKVKVVNGTFKWVQGDYQAQYDVDVMYVDSASAGPHTAKVLVTGDSGTAECSMRFDVFDEGFVNPLTISATIPKITFCDTDHDGWKPQELVMGMVEQVRCHPGAMLANGLASYGIGYVPKIKITTPKPAPYKNRWALNP